MLSNSECLWPGAVLQLGVHFIVSIAVLVLLLVQSLQYPSLLWQLLPHCVVPRAFLTMPRPAKPEADVAKDKTIRAQELKQEQLLKKIHRAIDCHPSKAAAFWGLLEDLGVTDHNYNVAEAQNGDISWQKRAQLQRKRSLQALRQDESDRAAKLAKQRGAEKPFSTACVDLAHLTVPTLQEILSELEPGAWSRGNLNVHQRGIGKPGLVQMLEFATGLEGDYKVWDDWVCQVALTKFLKELYITKGSRGSKCSLPLDWPVKGIYVILAVSAESSEVVILHRFTRAKVPVAIAETGEGASIQSHKLVDDYELLCNWSESKATVRARTCVGGFRLSKRVISHKAIAEEDIIIQSVIQRQRSREIKAEDFDTPQKSSKGSGPSSGPNAKEELVAADEYGLADAAWDDNAMTVPPRQ